MDIGAVLENVVPSSVGIVVVAYLARNLLSQVLTKDLERFRTNLTTEAALGTERLRADLERVAVEHQVRFTRLHEKRTYIIATIYASVETLHGVLRNWNNVSAILRDEPETRMREAAEFRELATKAKNSLEIFYYRRAIWLERDLCDLLNNLINSLSLLLTMLDSEGKGTPLVTQGKNDSRELANEVLGIAAATRAALEKRFRAILGIADTDAQ